MKKIVCVVCGSEVTVHKEDPVNEAPIVAVNSYDGDYEYCDNLYKVVCSKEDNHSFYITDVIVGQITNKIED